MPPLLPSLVSPKLDRALASLRDVFEQYPGLPPGIPACFLGRDRAGVPGFYKTSPDDADGQLGWGTIIPDRNHVANLSVGLGEGLGEGVLGTRRGGRGCLQEKSILRYEPASFPAQGARTRLGCLEGVWAHVHLELIWCPTGQDLERDREQASHLFFWMT